jgi:hypothetical protein
MLSLTCIHCGELFTEAVKAGPYAAPLIGETDAAMYARLFPRIGKHLEDHHPEAYQLAQKSGSNLMGMLICAAFKTESPDVLKGRTETAAALHQLTRRTLTDEDIEKSVRGRWRHNLTVTQTIELVKQLRDYLEYRDVLEAATKAAQPEGATA